MKRLLLALVIVASLSPLASAEERESWFVRTAIPASHLIGLDGMTTEQSGFDRILPAIRRVEAEFTVVDGFASQLTPKEAAQLLDSPFVLSVEKAGTVRASETAPMFLPADEAEQVVPWGVARVGAERIWPYTRGRTVRVAVIDTGVDHTHPDLIDVYAGGYDFVNRDDDPMDDRGHGTHVAGTIAAVDNAVGVVGVAPEVEIYALKVLDGSGSGSSINVIEAVQWSIENEMDVINLSLGGSTSTQFEQLVYNQAADAGIVVVAAAGNGHPEVVDLDYPARYDNVISVAAADQGDLVAGFSQRSGTLDFSAPGVQVDSTYMFPLQLVTEDGIGIKSRVMEYSPIDPVSGRLVPSGLGYPEDFTDEVAGAIAFIQRGELTFAEKAKNAAAAGAIGAVVWNHTPEGEENGGIVNGTLGEEGEWITTVGISRESGLFLIGLEYPSITMATRSDYGSLNGTSMATPHVAGVFALLRALDPSLNRHQLFEAARKGARDAGLAGRDTEYGFGLIDALEAARHIAPEVFGEPTTGSNDDDGDDSSTRRRGARRGGS